MTKSVSHISQRIICPKCGTRNLRKSIPAKSGQEYFCDKDHEYFGIAELVNVWGYDAGDFYGMNGQAQLSPEEWGHIIFLMKKPRENSKRVSFVLDWEGEWSSEIARDESYDVVNRMLAGIEELEWDFDVRDLPCPILQTGMC